MIVAESQGHGSHLARRIRDWLHAYLSTGQLPLHKIGRYASSLLDDEDFSLAIKLHLQAVAEKDGHFRANTIVDYVASPEMQATLEEKGVPLQERTISVWTARRWLKSLDYRFGRRKNGMYVDGHERDDIVKYRMAFVKRWIEEYEPRIAKFNNDGVCTGLPGGTCPDGKPYRLIVATHDESTFFGNDRNQTGWIHDSFKAKPEAKGQGQSIMVSDFLTPEWGRLVHGEEEAQLLFQAGKNRDGYFTNKELLPHVSKAIDIFEARVAKEIPGGAVGLFPFDNAPSHQKRAADALSARKMPKGPSQTWGQSPKMRPGTLPGGARQEFYYPDNHPEMPGWFKGMQQILEERGLFHNGMLAQCPGFKCDAEATSCCCRRTLFNQPDFINQKSALQELVESRGHICDFYPKYHCELNFIEMYWGAAKFKYRKSPSTKNIEEMEANVKRCLDEVPQLFILRFSNRAVRFISGYYLGCTGKDLGYLQKEYKSHRMLPYNAVTLMKQSV
ncbi:hypothetical protein B0H16DRAFT_1769592, partial [Mycena metata]